MENWYVYYPAPAALALPLLQEMQRQLVPGAVQQARVEERVGSGTAPTWMEVYEGVKEPDSFAMLLDVAVGRAGLTAEQRAARHVERFRAL
jgi:hypothetical protein